MRKRCAGARPPGPVLVDWLEEHGQPRRWSRMLRFVADPQEGSGNG